MVAGRHGRVTVVCGKDVYTERSLIDERAPYSRTDCAMVTVTLPGTMVPRCTTEAAELERIPSSFCAAASMMGIETRDLSIRTRTGPLLPC